jgi:hypothetical protein
LEIPQKADEKMNENSDGNEAKKLCQQWREWAGSGSLVQM